MLKNDQYISEKYEFSKSPIRSCHRRLQWLAELHPIRSGRRVERQRLAVQVLARADGGGARLVALGPGR